MSQDSNDEQKKTLNKLFKKFAEKLKEEKKYRPEEFTKLWERMWDI